MILEVLTSGENSGARPRLLNKTPVGVATMLGAASGFFAAGQGMHLSREIDRILNRLERLQRMRRGQPLSPQIDVKIA